MVPLTLYLHRDKGSNWSTWEDELGQPENEAGRRFSYAAYEVEVQGEVDLDSGVFTATHFDGEKLANPVVLS